MSIDRWSFHAYAYIHGAEDWVGLRGLSRFTQMYLHRPSQLTDRILVQLELARASMDLFRSCEEVYEGIVRSGTWPCDLPPSSYSQYFT